jgi:hypothetical protein
VTTDDGLTLAEIEAGKQGCFVAVSGNVTLSDADAKLTEVFNGAPSGGGAVKILADETLVSSLASKAGNNTFTGSNVFNGALSGNGTLYGMPMQHWLGKAAILSGCEIASLDMAKKVFPEHSTMTVLHSCAWNESGGFTYDKMKNLFPNVEYAYCEMDDSHSAMTRCLPQVFSFPKIKEYWFAEKGSGRYYLRHYASSDSYLFFPKWKNYRLLIILHGPKKTANKCRVFVPLESEVIISIEHYGSEYLPSEYEFLGNNSIKTFRIYNSRTRMRLINGVFPSCTNLEIESNILLERDSLLTLIGSLPVYDSAKMTTVPTASIHVDPELQGDEEVTAALLNLQAAVEDGGKGWTLAITGITLGGAATFGLRKVYYYARREDADGSYIDAAGQRWDVSGGTTVLRNYEANEQLPEYSSFLSLEDALAEWGLHEITPEESKADYERRYGALTETE